MRPLLRPGQPGLQQGGPTSNRVYSEAGFTGTSWPEGVTGDTTTWHYEEATGLLLAKEDAAGAEVTYTYGAGGKLATRTWARDNGSIITTYGYDEDTGELLTIDYSDATPDVHFTYDALGRQETITDAVGTRTMAYNGALQLESETVSGLYDRVISRSYEQGGDEVPGRPSGFSVGADYAVDYGYDRYGRLDTVGWQAGGAMDVASYSYLAKSDLLEGLSTGSGQETLYGYELKRNLKTNVINRFNGNRVSQYDYRYDSLGE